MLKLTEVHKYKKIKNNLIYNIKFPIAFYNICHYVFLFGEHANDENVDEDVIQAKNFDLKPVKPLLKIHSSQKNMCINSFTENEDCLKELYYS